IRRRLNTEWSFGARGVVLEVRASASQESGAELYGAGGRESSNFEWCWGRGRAAAGGWGRGEAAAGEWGRGEAAAGGWGRGEAASSGVGGGEERRQEDGARGRSAGSPGRSCKAREGERAAASSGVGGGEERRQGNGARGREWRRDPHGARPCVEAGSPRRVALSGGRCEWWLQEGSRGRTGDLGLAVGASGGCAGKDGGSGAGGGRLGGMLLG
ncbi:hypothetical protein BRADI_3g43513v3, partial [Brachypodium distachyon]